MHMHMHIYIYICIYIYIYYSLYGRALEGGVDRAAAALLRASVAKAAGAAWGVIINSQ